MYRCIWKTPSSCQHRSSFYCHRCFSKLLQYCCLSNAYRAAVICIGRCTENAADLPEHRFLAAIFPTDDITRVLRSCDDDDNEHMLQIARTRVGYGAGVSLQRGVGLLPRPGQERHVLRLVCVWSWLGRWCVPAVQPVRLQLPQRQVCAWPTLHVGSLDSPSSCTSDALAVFQGYVRKVLAVSRETRPCLPSFWP